MHITFVSGRIVGKIHQFDRSEQTLGGNDKLVDHQLVDRVGIDRISCR